MSRFLTAARQVLSFLWNTLKAAHTLVFGALSVALVAGLFLAISSSDTAEVPDGGALVLNPTGMLVEQKTALDFSTVLQGQSIPSETLVRDVVEALELAAADERIQSLVLRLDGLAGGMLPRLQRVSAAIDAFKSSGKRVVATGMSYSQSAIFLAAGADEILMNPQGSATPEGYSMHRTYYKTLLENFDVTINLFKVGKYKSAVEPFFRDSMSDEDKEARMGILNNWWDAYTAELGAARKLQAGAIEAMQQDVPRLLREANGDLAQLALALGLVDRLATNDEQRAFLVELTGEDEDTGEYRRIGFEDYLAVERVPQEPGANKVAVITAVGSIVDGSAKSGGIGSLSLTKLIRKAHDDDKVKAIVLRVDSGGGSKSASEIIRRELAHVQESGIPVVASMGSVAASGGYWISASADEIWALPTTLTGSIGIFGLVPTFEKTLARYGVNSDGVGTTPLAGGVAIDRGMSPTYAEVMQQVIEAGYREFLELVAGGRDMSTEAVHEIAQGRIWSGVAALELGLVDQLGDLPQAIASAAALADIDDYSVWYVEPEMSTQDQVLQNLMSEVTLEGASLGVDPISRITSRIRKDLEFLGSLNDPRDAYVICGSCPME